MTGYILSILGIIIAGIIIEIIVPAGAINKYIKGVYSLFVVAVLISPIMNFATKDINFKFAFNDYVVDEKLHEYIASQRVNSVELNIEKTLADDGFSGVDINIEFSLENNSLLYKNCYINLQNLVIDLDKQHINKYEFITKVVVDHTNLTEEEIVFDGK